MARKIIRQTRDRHLTPEEREKYQLIRAQIEQEKPEIEARIRSHMKAMSAAQEVFQQLKELRDARGLSLRDIESLTGIDASSLSKLERGERENFTVDTIVRYAEALGKGVAISLFEPA